MSTWFHKHRQESSSCYNSVTPRVQILLRERFITTQHMNAVALNQFEYDVKGGEIDAVVHLGQKSCSCREFDIDRIPCVHALAAMEDKDFERVA